MDQNSNSLPPETPSSTEGVTPPTEQPVTSPEPTPPVSGTPPLSHEMDATHPALKAPSGVKKIITLTIALLMLTGVLLSGLYVLSSQKKSTPSLLAAKQPQEITVPSDAVQIQACSSHRGALYVRPRDIPVGPVYMVYKGKVIGIEFMLGKEEILAGKSYLDLAGVDISINHVNIGLLNTGHAGYPLPHYHVDMYTVKKNVEQAITCAATPSPSTSASSPSAVTSPAIVH